VRIPTALRPMTQGETTVSAPQGTVAEVLSNLVESYPALAEVIFDADGEVRRFLGVFVDQDDIRALDGMATKVEDGATMMIMSAVAGG